ncbi:MAG: SprT family zinc-dependent metalloprotease [Pseudomonadota bacterium]
MGENNAQKNARNIEVRRNNRSRRITLRIDNAKGRAVVTIPPWTSERDALTFAAEHQDWIDESLARRPAPTPFAIGAVFPLIGRDTIIEASENRRTGVRLVEAPPDPTADMQGANAEGASGDASSHQRLQVGGDPECVNRRVTDWLKKTARFELQTRCDAYVQKLRVKRGAITVRDTRSRWGSCSSTGALSFSWRLVFAPSWIIDYVAAHECAHLIEMNHSPTFWEIVASLGVDHDDARRWFADNGEKLYAYGQVA